MICPFCKSSNLKVVDKRESNEKSIRRRRECINCSKRFTTYERIEKVHLTVKKRNGKFEEFDREKLKRGIMKAINKRGIPESKIDLLISEIENELIGCDSQIITSVEIGEIALRKLTQIDKLGALLFASVYREFKSLEEVQDELMRLTS